MVNFKVVSVAFVSFAIFLNFGSTGLAQKTDITGKPDDGLDTKTDMTLLKDGSEKAHVKEKGAKKSKVDKTKVR